MRVSEWVRLLVMPACGVLALLLTLSLLPPSGPPKVGGIPEGSGDWDRLAEAYRQWEEQTNQSGEKRLVVDLAWNKALSREYTQARGRAAIDLENGKSQVVVQGLENPQIGDVWLLQNVPGAGRNAAPEVGDKMALLGSLSSTDDRSVLETQLDKKLLDEMEIEWIVVTQKGVSPADGGGVLWGSASLFQKLHHYAERRLAKRPLWAKLADAVLPKAEAHGISPLGFPNAAQLNRGRKLFLEETFEGNGRTCGTCHPPKNNFTIDPKFIATLPDNDALFVAEFPAPNPLSQNFEKPLLMRKLGLILENTNGFGDLENNFTMRGVPHTLALNTSLEPSSNDGTTNPPAERTGWSGDGAPVNLSVTPPLLGDLNAFAVGAVTQHFTKTLGRVAGVDFRLPTQQELADMEAFQRSLGRQSDPNLATTVLRDPVADRGRQVFLGDGLEPIKPDGNPNTACNFCHVNAGATTLIDGTNFNFNTNAEGILDQPADIIDPANNPDDDGFGQTIPGLPPPPASGTFNTPPVIEAADTGPFFHNNSVETLEAAVAFYSGPNVNITVMDGSQITGVSLFLRVMNADDNLATAILLEEKASRLNLANGRVNLMIAVADLEDAVQVLREGRIHCDDAVPLIEKAIELDEEAISTTSIGKRNELIAKALELKQKARETLIVPVTP